MKSFFGIPAHPLLVHFPTVLLPLAAIGVVLMVVRPAWQQRYRWSVLAIGFAGAVGAVLAAGAGESFAETVTAKEGAAAAARWDDHAEAGDTARLFAVIFFILLALFILVPWYLERRSATPKAIPKWATLLMTALVLLGAVGSVVTVILAGHSGATAVWCNTNTPPNCPTGG